ncbi:MAG: hypothetical protein WBF93_11275, partial [Pirellulales bacterium]
RTADRPPPCRPSPITVTCFPWNSFAIFTFVGRNNSGRGGYPAANHRNADIAGIPARRDLFAAYSSCFLAARLVAAVAV